MGRPGKGAVHLVLQQPVQDGLARLKKKNPRARILSLRFLLLLLKDQPQWRPQLEKYKKLRHLKSALQ